MSVVGPEDIEDDLLVDHAHLRGAAYGLTIPTGAKFDAALNNLSGRAQRRLFAQDRTISTRLAREEIGEALVKDTITDMALRVIANPNGYRSVSIDDFQATIDQAISAGRMRATADELRDLRPVRRRAPGRSVGLALPRHRWPGA